MCLILQGIKFEVQVLKPCKSVQETSEEVLFIKARQLFRQLVSIEAQGAILARGSTAAR